MARSGFEMRVREDLDKRGVPYQYEPFKIRYEMFAERLYTPDIVLPNNIIVELKGYFTTEDRVKHLRIKESHPELDIRFVFSRAKNRISSASKTTYAAWCEKHGFKWAERTIPDAWLREGKAPEAPVAEKKKKVTKKTDSLVFAGPEGAAGRING